MKPSRSLFVDVRGHRYHVRSWGPQGAPKLFMLHGWMDVSASFQFVVDALEREWHVLAPDWRGFGLSDWTQADSYWYPDYLADLDAILDHFVPAEAADIVGHSMGGNIMCVYAGARPDRVRRFVNLEGLGMPDNVPAQAPKRFAQWLDELHEKPRLRDYSSFAELAARLREKNPRLTSARAEFLAQHWGAEENGRVVLRSDPRHKTVNPILYRSAEVEACMRRIAAPVLWVQGADTDIPSRFRLSVEEIGRRKACIAKVTDLEIADAAHMLHHDQPELLAREIERFLAA
jgi:pimeloyl-ACP methyl ester carboxylesterase